MNDIFLSYASSDRAIAKKFADALESLGWSVWWDREIPVGRNFDRTIEEQLAAAGCVVVLWSGESVRSRWVRAEASAAAARECLIPVLIDQVPIPLEFTLIQAAELANWGGDTDNPEFRRLVEAVQQMLKHPPAERAELKEKKTDVAPAGPQTSRRPSRAVWIVAAALIIATLFLGRTIFQRLSSIEPSRSAGSSSTSAQASTNAGSRNGSSNRGSQNSGQTAAPEGAIAIKIGDKVGNGIPAPAAGFIKAPFDQNVYAFTAAPGQRVYFRMLRYSKGMEQLIWRLADPTGTEVFNTCVACTEPGVQTLNNAGTYVLTLGSRDNPSTGTYEFQLFDVPAPSRFSIKIGDRIAENIPGAGAGIIESPGAQDIYTFTAAARQMVYFRVLEHSAGMEQIKLQLADENGMEIFNTCLACTEPGVQALTKGGTYTLAIGHNTNAATGTYRLQLFNVPPPLQFSIKLGDRIRQGVPGPGAGVVESPGAEDVYSFNAAPGQKVYFRMLEHGPGMEQIRWRLVDDNGMDVFDTCLGCSQPGLQTLVKGGSYMLILGNKRNPATGNYSFEIGAK